MSVHNADTHGVHFIHILPGLKYDNVIHLFSPLSDIINGGFEYQVRQNHSVFLYHEDSEEMYVGGTGFVLKLDVDDFHIIEVGVFWTLDMYLLSYLFYCVTPLTTWSSCFNGLFMSSQPDGGWQSSLQLGS